MLAAASKPLRRKLGPYSRVLARGAIGDAIDGRSREGRLIRALERELVQHVGGSPSITQRLLIERAIKLRLQLDFFDQKLASGEWTPHDARTYAGALGAFRLAIRELGLKAAGRKPESLDSYLARIGTETREGEAT